MTPHDLLCLFLFYIILNNLFVTYLITFCSLFLVLVRNLASTARNKLVYLFIVLVHDHIPSSQLFLQPHLVILSLSVSLQICVILVQCLILLRHDSPEVLCQQTQAQHLAGPNVWTTWDSLGSTYHVDSFCFLLGLGLILGHHLIWILFSIFSNLRVLYREFLSLCFILLSN